MRQTRNSQLAMLLLLLLTAWFYAHALDLNFIWDDPLWYGRVVGKSLRELVRPMTDYHFYRPTLVLYNRLFLQPDDSLAAPLLHAAQIGWHLLNVALAYALSRRLGLSGWTAVAVGGLVACYPFSYQAVAWAAPAQPMAAALGNGALLAYVEARRKRARHRPSVSFQKSGERNQVFRKKPGFSSAKPQCIEKIRPSIGLSFLLFLAALTVQEGAVVLAALPLLIEWVLHRRNGNKTDWWLSLIYPLVAAVFGLLWLRIPRQAGYTTMTFDSSVALYLLQGLIFPLIGRPGGYASGQTIAPGILLTLTGIVLGGLLVASWRARRGRQALFGLAWAVLGIAPVVVGLRYSYVKLASRLLYYSSPGVAMLWACALLPKPEPGFFGKNLVSLRRLWQSAGTLVLALIALQSWLLLAGFRQTYTAGIDHLAELVQIAQTQDARLLFVNFPDRYTPKRPPYPLGYWGVTLAPASVDLGAFPAIATGQHPHTTSRSIPSVDFDARENSPYYIDMRGEITPPDQLYQLAHQMDTVYLSRYLPDGTFALQWAGDVTAAPPDSSCQLATFGQTLCLQKVQADPRPGRLSLTLTWLSLSTAQPHDAVFAHVGTPYQPPIAQDDDDAWLGILPLAVWQPGDVVREQRIILLPQDAAEGQYQIRIGVYNRVTGERLSATTPYGEALLDNVFTLIGSGSASHLKTYLQPAICHLPQVGGIIQPNTAPARRPQMVEVKIESIRASLMSEHRVVVLQDINSERLLPIWIGRCEAEAIAIRLQNVETPRPLTHDLLNNTIAEMGGEISHITVNDLRNNTFYAQIAVKLKGRSIKIDSRPSDAIALAVRANATIFVAEHVMAEASIIPESDVTEEMDDEDLSVFRDFINTLDLDDLPVQ